MQVAPKLTLVGGLAGARSSSLASGCAVMSASSMDVPGVWSGAGHNEIAWCNQLAQRLGHMLLAFSAQHHQQQAQLQQGVGSGSEASAPSVQRRLLLQQQQHQQEAPPQQSDVAAAAGLTGTRPIPEASDYWSLADQARADRQMRQQEEVLHAAPGDLQPQVPSGATSDAAGAAGPLSSSGVGAAGGQPGSDLGTGALPLHTAGVSPSGAEQQEQQHGLQGQPLFSQQHARPHQRSHAHRRRQAQPAAAAAADASDCYDRHRHQIALLRQWLHNTVGSALALGGSSTSNGAAAAGKVAGSLGAHTRGGAAAAGGVEAPGASWLLPHHQRSACTNSSDALARATSSAREQRAPPGAPIHVQLVAPATADQAGGAMLVWEHPYTAASAASDGGASLALLVSAATPCSGFRLWAELPPAGAESAAAGGTAGGPNSPCEELWALHGAHADAPEAGGAAGVLGVVCWRVLLCMRGQLACVDRVSALRVS